MRFDLFNTLVEQHLQIPCYRQVDLLVTCACTNHIVIDFPNPYNYFVYMDNDLLTIRTEFNCRKPSSCQRIG